MRIRLESSIAAIDAPTWDGLDHGPSPFLRHGFLRAMEESGSIGTGSGWYPAYLLAEDEGGRCLGATAAFIKTHSYGEYIFDWGWANAAEQAGLSYYPKLVVAAPMTPATGRRILLAHGAPAAEVTALLAAGVREIADRAECSSIHWLFCTQEESEALAELGFRPRASFQFHWRNEHYRSFDDFLARLTSRKRKQLRKERARGLEVIDRVEFVPATELRADQIDAMDRYYRRTVNAHWGRDYLRPGFFERLVEYLPEHVLFADARRGGRTVAGALFLETPSALYGRYWGCDEHIDFLHFEVAYYAGIERCIERGLPLFEAGAQGEHKLLRGFLPARTYSNHWLRDPDLDRAVARFLRSERAELEAHMAALAEAGPFRKPDAPCE